MSTNYGDKVPRTLNIQDTSVDTVVWQARKPPLAEEFNFQQDLQNNARQTLAKALTPSGVLNFKLARQPLETLPTINDTIPQLRDSNQLAIQNFLATLNGWTIPVVTSRVNGGDFLGATNNSSNYCVVKLDPPPPLGVRHDLLFLEVWRALISPAPSSESKPDADNLYRYGNVQYKGSQVPDEMIEPQINIETSRRVQLQYRIRNVSGINLVTSPNGVDDANVYAQGGSQAATTYRYLPQIAGNDAGLYIAGDGTPQAQSILKSVDGVVYAIPLMAVARRNSSPYSLVNPNGSGVSLKTGARSDRPDGLFNDEIALRDLIDLRHKVIVNDPDFSSILEKNFRELTLGRLRTKWDTDYTGSTFGTELTEVDSISQNDQQGTYTIAKPDGIRRSFSNEVISQPIVDAFAYGTDKPTGIIQYYSNVNGLQQIYIDVNSYGVGSTVLGGNNSPIISMVSTGATIGSSTPGTGWSGLGTSRASYTLDPTTLPAGTKIGDMIQVVCKVSFPGSGLRYIPTSIYRVNNIRPDAPAELGFAFTNTPRQALLSQATANPGVLPYFPDVLTDFPLVPTSSGYTRLRYYHIQGNGSASYQIPKTLDGQNVSCLVAVRRAPVSGGAFVDVPITSYASIVKNTGSTFTVTLPSIFTAADVLQFQMVISQVAATFEPTVRGIQEMGQDSSLKVSSPSSGVTDIDLSSPNANSIILSAPQYTIQGQQPTYFAYVNGVMRAVTVVTGIPNSGFGNTSIRIRFPATTAPQAGDNIEFPVVLSYAPTTLDTINITYGRKAYQGWADTLPINGSEILAVGTGLVHTMGTLTSVVSADRYLRGMAQNLPLASGKTEALMSSAFRSQADTPSIASNMLRVILYNPGTAGVYNGTLPSVGDHILEVPVVQPNIKSVRGVSNSTWALALGSRKLTSDSTIEFQTPALLPSNITSGADYHQVVWYALIRHSVTGELLMVVLTAMSDNKSVGREQVTATPSAKVAYDVFRVDGRPLLLN